MMKGHTIIELMDPETGSVTDRVESDNMFTDAIAEMVNFAYTHSLGKLPVSNIYATHWEQLLGGILLFDSPIDEQADNYYAPAGVRMTGCGSYGFANANANMKYMGTYNSSESDTSQANVKKFVYDFSTEQANGTIAAVCLTHKNAGYGGYGSSEIGGYVHFCKDLALGTAVATPRFAKQSTQGNFTSYGTVNSTYVDFCIDSGNDMKYMCQLTSDALKILKHPMSQKVFNVFRAASADQPYELKEYELPFTVSNTNYYHFYNTDEKALYIWGSWVAEYYGNNDQVRVFRFDMETEEITSFIWKNTTGSNVMSSLVFHDGYVYMRERASGGRIFKQNTATGDRSILTGALGSRTSYYSVKHCYVYKGLVYFCYETYAYTSSPYYYRDVIVDSITDEVLYSPCYHYVYQTTGSSYLEYVIPPIDNKQMVFGTGQPGNVSGSRNQVDFEGNSANGTDYGNTYAMVNYLATINNLETPVIKTANRTMKVTYIITEETEPVAAEE